MLDMYDNAVLGFWYTKILMNLDEFLALHILRDTNCHIKHRKHLNMSIIKSDNLFIAKASTFPVDLPLVSVIIISYNDRKYVGEAINSALAQTYPNCEVIVVDDGSMDGTGEFIAKYYGDRVRYQWKENGGMGSARYTGLHMASGKYIQHLDSDDMLLPDKVASQVAYLEAHCEIAFVYGRTIYFCDDDRTVTYEHPENAREHPLNARARSGNVLDDYVRNGNFINIGHTLTRREWIDRIGGWDASIRGCDDVDIMLRLAYAGAEGYFLDRPVYMYHYTLNTRNLSDTTGGEMGRHDQHNWVEFKESDIYAWEKLRLAMRRDSHPSLALVTKRVGYLHFHLGKHLFGRSKRLTALNHLWRGLLFNRERWAYKMAVLAAVAFLPGAQLRELSTHLRVAFQKTKGCTAKL